MASSYYYLFMEQGVTFSIDVQLDDQFGANYNLINHATYSQMKKSYYAKTAVCNFNTYVDTGNSRINLSLSAQDSANISPGRYVYDVIIVDTYNNSNTVVRVLEGIAEVSPRVTIK
jgi:hypothetical protein